MQWNFPELHDPCRTKITARSFQGPGSFSSKPCWYGLRYKKMYLQIEVKEQDRSHFRLLWRDLDPNREPDVFEFNRVVFGKNSAPMESQFVA